MPAGEIRREVFALDYLESPQNGLSINFAIGQRQLREALAGSQRELGNTARQID